MTTASIALRPVVRDVMKMAPTRQWSEAGLLMQLRTLAPEAKAVDVLAAIVWNQGKDYVKAGRNEELECDVWTLTEKGLAAA
jgi:hypothetical protein